MKEIVIINQDSGYLTIDLANAYYNAGFKVILVAGRLVVRNKPLHEGIKVVRIVKYNRLNMVTRLLSWVFGAFHIWVKLVFQIRHSHILFVSNPPIAPFINLFIDRKYTLLIYDVFPEGLEEIGFFSNNSIVFKIWAKLNYIVYRKAERIITISDSMAKTIQFYAPNREIEVIPIWSDNNYLKAVSKGSNVFIKNNFLHDKFIVLYSGNLGHSANAEIVVELAKSLKFNLDIVFLIIGEGSFKKSIAKEIEKNQLTNCLLFPWQDSKMFPFSLSSADLAIVSMAREAGRLALPSKLFDYLSVGVPILGICSKDSEIERFIYLNKIGNSFDFEQKEKICEYILNLSKDQSLQEKLHQNVINTSKFYDSSIVMRFVENHKN